MLLVASETGHVYTFATPKLQPMITSEAGKALIQTCLHQPDPAPISQGPHQGDFDVRMSSTGYEETDLGYGGLGEEESYKVSYWDRDISGPWAVERGDKEASWGMERVTKKASWRTRYTKLCVPLGCFGIHW